MISNMKEKLKVFDIEEAEFLLKYCEKNKENIDKITRLALKLKQDNVNFSTWVYLREIQGKAVIE